MNTANRANEVCAFYQRESLPERLPGWEELRSKGRADIASAVDRYGGWKRCAEDTGLLMTS